MFFIAMKESVTDDTDKAKQEISANDPEESTGAESSKKESKSTFGGSPDMERKGKKSGKNRKYRAAVREHRKAIKELQMVVMQLQSEVEKLRGDNQQLHSQIHSLQGPSSSPHPTTSSKEKESSKKKDRHSTANPI
jgi:hypothetical protein